jgi:hypothetical protein
MDSPPFENMWSWPYNNIMQDVLTIVEKEIRKRKINDDTVAGVLKDNPMIAARRIIGGYSSVNVVDREGQRIPIYALKEAVKRFMTNPHYRNAQVFHSDVQIGRVLPKWTSPETGNLYTTHVDDTGWWTLVELRDDVEIANKTWAEVLKGNIRSFSIAGTSKEKLQKQENGQRFEEVKSLDILETTLCQVPVNQLSKFDVLWTGTKDSFW